MPTSRDRWRVKVSYNTWRRLRRIYEVVQAYTLSDVIKMCADYSIAGITGVRLRPIAHVIVDVYPEVADDVREYANRRGISYAKAIDELSLSFYMFLSEMGIDV